MIPADLDDPQAQYDLLREEVRQHSPSLAEKPHCVVLTKADLIPEGEHPTIDAPDAWGSFTISSVTRQGVPALLEGLWRRAEEARRAEAEGDLAGGDEEGEGAERGPW
jgi:GTP-binding protein